MAKAAHNPTLPQNRALVLYEQAVAEGFKPPGEGKRGESAVSHAADRLATEAHVSVAVARCRIQRAINSNGAGVCVVEADNQPLLADPKDGSYRQRAVRAERLLKNTQEELSHALRIREEAFGLAPVQSAGWRAVASSPSGRSETPVLFTSDFQVGEVIREEDTRGYNAFNLDIFRKRYRRLIEATIGIVKRHHGDADHIVYLRGGDSISGSIHPELADTDEVAPPMQCVALLQEEIAGIKSLAEAFGRVTVVSIPGNHDRIGIKPRAKTYSDHSYETLIQFALEAAFKNDDRVTFITDKSGDVLFKVHATSFLLTHGDRIGSNASGPNGIINGAKKVHAAYAREGFNVDYVLGGHFHTPVFTDGVLFNGCLPGYSEYARTRMRVAPSPPSQTLFFVHEDHGITAVRNIYVNGRAHGESPDQPGSRGPFDLTKKRAKK